MGSIMQANVMNGAARPTKVSSRQKPRKMGSMGGSSVTARSRLSTSGGGRVFAVGQALRGGFDRQDPLLAAVHDQHGHVDLRQVCAEVSQPGVDAGVGANGE